MFEVYESDSEDDELEFLERIIRQTDADLSQIRARYKHGCVRCVLMLSVTCLLVALSTIGYFSEDGDY